MSDNWGDDLEAALKSIGVSQEWWVAAKKAHGLPPECQCEARKAWLNRVGRWWAIKRRMIYAATRQVD